MTRRVLHAFSSFAIGGPQTRFIRIAEALGPALRHDILAMDGDYAAAARLGRRVDYRLRNDIAARKSSTLSNIIVFRRLLARERPDLLVTYNWGAIEWAAANTPAIVPHLHAEDGFGADEAAGQLRRRALFRRFALAGKPVIVASRALETAARRRWGVARGKLFFVANGVDASRFARSPDPALAARLGDPADGPLIGTVASLRPEKNLGRLIDAFARIVAQRTARLAIIGEGSERGALEARVRSLGLSSRVFLPGAISDPSAILAAFDLFMLSSDTEQAPLSLLEAMAAGLPAACTDVGDIAVMASAENRPFIVAPDAQALASAALALLGDPALRARIGAANRARSIEAYSEAAMIDRWRALLGDPASVVADGPEADMR